MQVGSGVPTHSWGPRPDLPLAPGDARKDRGCVGLLGVGTPEGPSTQYLRFLVPKTMLLMVFGPKDLRYWVLGPSGILLVNPKDLDPTSGFSRRHKVIRTENLMTIDNLGLLLSLLSITVTVAQVLGKGVSIFVCGTPSAFFFVALVPEITNIICAGGIPHTHGRPIDTDAADCQRMLRCRCRCMHICV